MLDYDIVCFPCISVCKCDGDGTQPSTVCEPHGGQCKCKENIILRQCGICRVDSYGNHLIGGCIGTHRNLQTQLK